jgi:hypothetical protein
MGDQIEIVTEFYVSGEWIQGTTVRASDWRKRTFFEHCPVNFDPENPELGVEYSEIHDEDDEHEWIEKTDVPSLEEAWESHRRYGQWVATHGEDPLGEYYVRNPIVHDEAWECLAEVRGFNSDTPVLTPSKVRCASYTSTGGGESLALTAVPAEEMKHSTWADIEEAKEAVRDYFILEGVTLDEVDKHVVGGSLKIDETGTGTVILTSAPDQDAFRRTEVTPDMLRDAATASMKREDDYALRLREIPKTVMEPGKELR